MSNPLSPLSPSYQNSRARSSPKMGSSPFLTEPSALAPAPDATIPSSPLKQTWTDRNTQSPNPKLNYSYPNESENEENFHPDDFHANNDYHDRDDFQEQELELESELEPASSPFRPDAREDTVDFQKLREYQHQQQQVTATATTPRHRFGLAQPEDPMSSPFRPDAQDENDHEDEDGTVDFQKLREEHPLSPGLDKRLAVNDPASSPFRPDVRDEYEDETVGADADANYRQLRDVEPLSPGLENRFAVEDPASSPFRPDARDETVGFEKLRQMQRLSPDVGEQLQPESSPFRADLQEDGFEVADFDEREYDLHQDSRRSIGRVQQSLSPSPTPADAYDSPVQLDAQNDAQENDAEPEERSRESLRESIGEIKQHSPVRRNVKDDSNQGLADSEELHEAPRPRESIGRVENSPPVPAAARSSLSKQRSPEEPLEAQKLRSSRRSLHRTSLGLEGRQSFAATPRKRSFDETPRGQEEAQAQESCKKGMVSRSEVPDIHIDLDEESSVIHNESLLSMTSATRDQSTIANSMMEDRRNEGMSTFLQDENAGADENSALGDDCHDSMDDTGLSNFSVLPDMTSFAKLRADSPLKSMRGSIGHTQSQRNEMYRQSAGPSTPGTARRPYNRASALLDTGSPAGSPTPRRRPSRDFENSRAAPNLLDFGDSVNFFPHQSVQQGGRYSPSRRSPMRPMRQSIRSPSKFSSLLDLDYEMAPAPTPRSLPSITPRELESLKSGFMSEISSLKATLSGKDAEVASLKTAISDAERRVGEALEEVRNEAGRREALEMEQAEWDRRGNEMESVLRSVRSELVDGEHERERLARRADEADKGKEQLEGRVVELESQLSAARSAISSGSNTSSSSRQVSQSTEATAREVQDAVEKVARELHTLYKGKHETKVAALKKSYESRWEKRLREVEKKLAAANEEQDRLRGELDTAQNDNMVNANASMIAREFDEYDAEKRVFEAQIEGLQHEMASLKEDSERLRSDLESERVEKGELVAAVDEWLAIQQAQAQAAPPQQREETRETREPSVSSAGGYGHGHGEEYLSSAEPAENPRRSVSRSGSSGVRPPVTGEKRSRFGAPAGAGHSRGNSGGKSGIAMYTPGRGGIMSSIERMGRGGV
ncbi:hypothetical protein N7481_008940 [Penicillium waksmanii]|uniref:uncharacterized protein n=1 Tax=Penicillium waksmanii TaxID=69791 RepID=UPI00254696EC|nr:uncharacterized protein N7481_008940 [Penicillium waksmanii]KAJ5975233.1 hypothetical protein N7481_008940 [Penicillium waksmanii]